MKIEEIKKKVNEAYYDGPVQDEFLYLLSIIEQAEKDMSEIIDLLIGDRYGEAWERSLEAYKTLRLKSIQGDE